MKNTGINNFIKATAQYAALQLGAELIVYGVNTVIQKGPSVIKKGQRRKYKSVDEKDLNNFLEPTD